MNGLTSDIGTSGTSRDVCMSVAIVPTNADVAYFCAKRRLQSGLDSVEQPEPHLVVIARERDHETHPAMA